MFSKKVLNLFPWQHPRRVWLRRLWFNGLYHEIRIIYVYLKSRAYLAIFCPFLSASCTFKLSVLYSQREKQMPTAIKATELELLLWFQIALVFVTWGFYMEWFLKKYRKWKTIEIFLPGVGKPWPTGQIWPNACFCKRSLIGTQPRICFCTVFGLFCSTTAELSSCNRDCMALKA